MLYNNLKMQRMGLSYGNLDGIINSIMNMQLTDAFKKYKGKPLTYYAMNVLILLLVLIPKEVETLFSIVPVRLLFMFALAVIFAWDYMHKSITLNSIDLRWYLIAYGIFLLLTLPSFFSTKSIVISAYTLAKFAMIGVILFIFSKVKLEEEDFIGLIKTFVFASSIIGIYAILQYVCDINLNPMGTDKYEIKGRVFATFFNPIYFSIFVNMVYFYLIYAYRRQVFKRPWIFILVLMLFAGMILSFTRSAILVFALMLLANIILNFRMMWNRYVLLTVALGIGLIFIIPGALGVTGNALQYGGELVLGNGLGEFTLDIDQSEETPDIDLSSDASLAHRAEFAGIANQIAYDHPYTGVGFGTYINYMESEDFSSHYRDYEGSITHPHSFFVLLSAEAGYPATIAYFASLVILMLWLFITWLKSIKYKIKSAYQLGTLSLIMIVGFIVVAYIAENSFYDTQISTLFYIVVGLTMNYINKLQAECPKLINKNRSSARPA